MPTGEGNLGSSQDAEHPQNATRRKLQAVVVSETPEETPTQLLPRVDGFVLQVHQPREGRTLSRQGEVPHEAPVAPPGGQHTPLVFPQEIERRGSAAVAWGQARTESGGGLDTQRLLENA